MNPRNLSREEFVQAGEYAMPVTRRLRSLAYLASAALTGYVAGEISDSVTVGIAAGLAVEANAFGNKLTSYMNILFSTKYASKK